MYVLQVEIERPEPGSLQHAFDELHAVKDEHNWIVIHQDNYLPSDERSFVGVMKGVFILELAEPPGEPE